MKKLSFLFLMVLPLTVSVSCSKDDKDKGNASIVGTWEFQSQTGDVVTNRDAATAEIKADIENSASRNAGTTVTFSEDGKAVTTSPSGSKSEYSYLTDGNKLTQIAGGNSQVSEFSISGNTLTVYTDMTEVYRSEPGAYVQNPEGVVISKVVIVMKYVRK